MSVYYSNYGYLRYRNLADAMPDIDADPLKWVDDRDYITAWNTVIPDQLNSSTENYLLFMGELVARAEGERLKALLRKLSTMNFGSMVNGTIKGVFNQSMGLAILREAFVRKYAKFCSKTMRRVSQPIDPLNPRSAKVVKYITIDNADYGFVLSNVSRVSIDGDLLMQAALQQDGMKDLLGKMKKDLCREGISLDFTKTGMMMSGL